MCVCMRVVCVCVGGVYVVCVCGMCGLCIYVVCVCVWWVCVYGVCVCVCVCVCVFTYLPICSSHKCAFLFSGSKLVI